MALSQEYVLVQAAWVNKYDEYAAFAAHTARSGYYVILDWQHVAFGAQHVTQSLDDFLTAIHRVDPMEVIIPDVLGDSEATLESLNVNLPLLQADTFSDVRTMFVPQGATVEEWIRCLQKGLHAQGRRINTIGVPKLLEQWGVHRASLVHMIPKEYEVHFLGVWNGAFETAITAGIRDRVRSWDTSLPVAAAQSNSLLSSYPNKKYQLGIDMPANARQVVENTSFLWDLLAGRSPQPS
jgi:hypothetical protein